jgi:hypothetical protein
MPKRSSTPRFPGFDNLPANQAAIENLAHAVSLNYLHYNFARPHQTLTRRFGMPTTPAMAAGIERYPWSYTQIAALLD